MFPGFCVETATFVTRRLPELPHPTSADKNPVANAIERYAPICFRGTGLEHTPMRPRIEQSRRLIGQFLAFWRTSTASVYPGDMRLFLVASCVVVGAAGCGSSSSAPETLTCDWLTGPNNCWTNLALTATTCLPPDTDQGVLSPINSTCTYATGEIVSFLPPLTLPTVQDMAWNFTIDDANAQPCLHYQDTSTGLTLSVGIETVTESLYGSVGMRITCQDGTSVQTANALALLNCPDPLGVLPGLIWSSSDTFVTAQLTGTGATSVGLFDCSK